MKRTFEAISPDVVIFEGIGYLNEDWDTEQSKNISLLSQILVECTLIKDCMFVFLSSTEVYGKTMEKATEEMEPCPQTLKGMWMLQEEGMIRNYRKYQGLNAAILRLTPIFSNEIKANTVDVFGRMYGKIMSATEYDVEEQLMQPIHISDVADAIIRVLDNGKTDTYNVGSTDIINKSDIVKELTGKVNRDVHINVTEPMLCNTVVANDKIKREVREIC